MARECRRRVAYAGSSQENSTEQIEWRRSHEVSTQTRTAGPDNLPLGLSVNAARPPPARRGLGIRRCDFASHAPAGLVVDLDAADAERLPPPEALRVSIKGISIPRIPVQPGFSGLPLVIAALTMTANSSSALPSADCSKEFGNHITPTLATE